MSSWVAELHGRRSRVFYRVLVRLSGLSGVLRGRLGRLPNDYKQGFQGCARVYKVLWLNLHMISGFRDQRQLQSNIPPKAPGTSRLPDTQTIFPSPLRCAVILQRFSILIYRAWLRMLLSAESVVSSVSCLITHCLLWF